MSGQGNWFPNIGEELDMSIEDIRRRFGVFRIEDQDAAYVSRSGRADALLQAAIGILTLLSLWLLTSNTPEARWGHWVGLASQPLYIVATWRARQWGMLFVAVTLIGVWSRGIVNNFF